MNHEQQIHTYGKDVIEALASMVKWKFDYFHKVMLAEFSVDKQAQVLSTLQQTLPVNWDIKTIKKAPEEVKRYAGVFSKLLKQQKLFSTIIELQPKVMFAWRSWCHSVYKIILTNSTPYISKTGFIHKLTRDLA